MDVHPSRFISKEARLGSDRSRLAGGGADSDAEAGDAALRNPAASDRHPDAVRDRHDRVLPDPRRAGRAVQPGARPQPEIKANLERVYGLDEPLWQQYLHYLNDLLHGNFGPSYNLPDFTVAELFAEGLPISVQLGASALILALARRRRARHHRRAQPEQGSATMR